MFGQEGEAGRYRAQKHLAGRKRRIKKIRRGLCSVHHTQLFYGPWLYSDGDYTQVSQIKTLIPLKTKAAAQKHPQC